MRVMRIHTVLLILSSICIPTTQAADTGEIRPGITSATGIEGQIWRITGYRLDQEFIESLPKTVAPELRFDAGRISGHTGCNQIAGGYSLDDGQLRIAPELASTMMACEEPLMRLEQAVTAALANVTRYQQEGDRLQLSDAQGQPQLTLTSLGPWPLGGVVWELQSLERVDQTPSPPVAGTQITLEFHARGRLSGSDGCNRYMSGYTLEDGRLTIGPVATTRMACRGAAGAAEQAAAYAAALGRVTGYRIENDRLTLLGADDQSLAHLQRGVETGHASD